MPRETLDRELQRLQDETLVLGSLVQKAITDSVEALKRRDTENSRRLIARDRCINKTRFSIEADACERVIFTATGEMMGLDLKDDHRVCLESVG